MEMYTHVHGTPYNRYGSYGALQESILIIIDGYIGWTLGRME